MITTASIRELNHKLILSLVSEYDIFKYYIGRKFSIGEAILSPLRKESNPSFVIYRAHYGSYKLRWVDFATSEGGTCFDFVMRLHNCDFLTALMIVDKDFNLGIVDCRPQLANLKPSIDQLEAIREYQMVPIEVGIRKWDSGQDKLYWQQYGITCKILQKYDVYPLSHFRVNGYEYQCSTITYGYYFGDGKWKIYSPYSQDKRRKWLSNTTAKDIQGYNQLPKKGNLLIITKALKDVMLLSKYDFNAIAPQAEGTMINDGQIEELKMRFNEIIINHDFDYIGVKTGNKYRKKWKFRCMYLTNGRFNTEDFGAKDLSDYYKLKGSNEFEVLLTKLNKNK